MVSLVSALLGPPFMSDIIGQTPKKIAGIKVDLHDIGNTRNVLGDGKVYLFIRKLLKGKGTESNREPP